MVNKVKAKTVMDHLLRDDSKYIFSKKCLSIETWHLAFGVNYPLHELQMTLVFKDRYVDILCFPDPIILKPEYNIVALKMVNYINWNVKVNGRFYVDDYCDIAYSMRIDYNTLDLIPHECAKEIECAVENYIDVF